MRASGAQFIDSIVRFASVLAALIIGVSFVMVTSVNAAEPAKKIEVNGKAKIEKIEAIVKAEKVDKLDSRARLNNARLNNLNNIRFINNRAFVRPFFNRGLFIDNDGLFE